MLTPEEFTLYQNERKITSEVRPPVGTPLWFRVWGSREYVRMGASAQLNHGGHEQRVETVFVSAHEPKVWYANEVMDWMER